MKQRQKILAMLLMSALAVNSFGTVTAVYATEETASESETMDLQILASSDTHGKFTTWDYAVNAEDTSGSMVQMSTAIDSLRNENTILVDAGDTIQGNSAELFLDEDIHPMILSQNEIGYDVCVTGNHEYNYGMDVLKKIMAQQESKPLVGNVYDEDGEAIADDYTIIEKNGVKVDIIGMVTPNITRWDSVNLKDCTVTDPVEEIRAAIDEIQDQVDVMIAVVHMDIENEYEAKDSGVRDLANACPELDLIVAAHGHQLIEGEEINSVYIIENKSGATTLAEIHLELEKSDNGWDVVNRTSVSHAIGEYDSGKELDELLAPYDEKAKEDASIVIGKLEGGSLAPENEIAEIPTAQIQDTALMDLIQEVQLYYTDADVSAAALFIMDANLHEGDIRKCDTAQVYKYNNTLYKIQMTGAQLKKYMEWTVSYYNTYKPGDLTISFSEDMRAYNYDMFQGVNYEINIANEVGSRIENLTWPDGTPVEDDDTFTIAVNNYRANSQLLTVGEVFQEGDELPVLLEMDVKGDIGGVRELIGQYISEVKGGTISPETDNNWKITGNNWNEESHEKAVELLKSGELTIETSADGRTPNVKSITEDDIK